MTTAYFDCYSGISGDMTLGAMVDLGIPIEELRNALLSLNVEGWEIEAKHVMRCGIGATHVKVHSHEHHPHRHFSHIKKIIDGSSFAPRVKERALEAFHKIAVAEAAIHETTVEKIHFHEVGAIDAIVDIIGAMWCVDQLGITDVLASPVAVGTGTVKAAHGEMPIPAPATAALLKGVPVSTGTMSGELTTPTGAAILTTLTSNFTPLQSFAVDKVGYGAGTREAPGQMNYLRVMLGTVAGAKTRSTLPVDVETIAVIQTEIDDMPAELFGYVQERLFAAGALDVHTSPAQMKKNRPGTAIEVLARTDAVDRLAEILFRETTTFGLRVRQCERYALKRRSEQVETPLGPVLVKIGLWGDDVLKVTPEYDDCRRIAHEQKRALPDVFEVVNRAISEWRTSVAP